MRRAMSIHSVAKSRQVLLFAGARRLIGIVRLVLLGVQCGVSESGDGLCGAAGRAAAEAANDLA